jgi:hypothetical protein
VQPPPNQTLTPGTPLQVDPPGSMPTETESSKAVEQPLNTPNPSEPQR